MTVTTNIRQYLEEEGVSYDIICHDETLTSSEEAKAVGIEGGHVAKTLVIKAGGGGEVLAVVPATERVDIHKLRDATNDNHARLATEQEMKEEHAEFELGAVPPLGELFGAPVLLDQRLEKADEVVFAGGTHKDSVKVSGEDFLKLTHPLIVDLVQEEGGIY
jgi:Ala-tRNA(Pro) deacylase